MAPKQRVPRSVSPAAIKLAEMINREVEARVGPDATFEEQQDAAAAVAAEMAEARRQAGPKVGG
jgi:hypothetical protein